MHPALNIAITAARKAGEILLQYRERLERVQIHKKAHQDYFSEVDILAEQNIIQILSKAYPNFGFVAEESGVHNPDAEGHWLIDPLDGTSNYLHEFPFYCVSIALKIKNQIDCGVIFDPLKQECFVASRGAGARLNDRRLRVSKTVEIDESLIGTTFSLADNNKSTAYKSSFQNVANMAAGTRKSGAVALELAYVAAGRLDGFVGEGLCAWDLAAGAIIVQEAGGMVSDLQGGENYLKTGHILASNPKIHRSIFQAF